MDYKILLWFPCRSNFERIFFKRIYLFTEIFQSFLFLFCRSGGVYSGCSGDTRWIIESDDRIWSTLRCEKCPLISHASRGVSSVRQARKCKYVIFVRTFIISCCLFNISITTHHLTRCFAPHGFLRRTADSVRSTFVSFNCVLHKFSARANPYLKL